MFAPVQDGVSKLGKNVTLLTALLTGVTKATVGFGVQLVV